MKSLSLCALFAVASGCAAPTTAVVNGQRVPRPTLAYTDHYYYAVTHYHAYPEARGASSGLQTYAGRVAGFACGADFHYEADYRGRSIQLLGYVQPITQVGGLNRIYQPAHIEVRDVGGQRHIRGSVGEDMGALTVSPQPLMPGRMMNAAGNWGRTPYTLAHDRPSKVIDFALDSSGLHGQIGSRLFALTAVGNDTLAGTVKVSTGEVLPFELRGLSSVWSMPAADQAAILPFMLTCSQVEEGRHIEGANVDSTAPLLVVDFRPQI
jgi:hypothetical protein